MTHEIAFEMAAASMRFGNGVTREVGMDLVDLGARSALVVTDATIAGLPPVQTVMNAPSDARVDAVLYDRVRIEPTDVSYKDAIDFSRAHPTDAIVAVGGGSAIDTAKAVNLYTTYPPADFLDYVNAPIGKAMPVLACRLARSKMLTPVVSLPVPAVVGIAISGFSGPGTGIALPMGAFT